MKVAIFEPRVRVCGVTRWAFEIVQGFRNLGHDCDLVTFTTSGRPSATRTSAGGPRAGWTWFTQNPDRTARFTDASDILDEYDLIVFPEPKNGPIDNKAVHDKIDPYYLKVLANTKTPWMTILHDAKAYTEKAAPFADKLMSTGKFTGVAVECRPGSYQCGEWAFSGAVKKIQPWPWLPYTPQGRAPHVKRERVIGLGGRMASNKGFSTLAAIAHELPTNYPVRFFGAESGGMGASFEFRLFESLVSTGWIGSRGNKDTWKGTGEWTAEIGNYAATSSSIPWVLRHPNGQQISYTGSYLNAVEEWTKCAIAVQLTLRNIATTLEYTALEALDAGCALIMPRHGVSEMRGASYDIRYIDSYNKGAQCNGRNGFRWYDDNGTELITAVQEFRGSIELGMHDPSVNQAALVRYHDPRLLANKIISLL